MHRHNDPRRDAARARPATTPLDPITVAGATDDALRRLVHEIAGLVDGSLRYLSLVHRDLARREDPDAPSPSLAYLDSATDALTRVASLVNDANGNVSRYSSITVGRRLSTGRSIREIVEHAAAVVRPMAEERGIALELALDGSLDRAPRLPIYPVLANALRNAVEACTHADHVRLHATVDGDRASQALVITVADTGPGPPAESERVFEPGFSTKPHNSGLGLALARDIVDELGGEIALEPNPDGSGALLRIRLPLETKGAGS